MSFSFLTIFVFSPDFSFLEDLGFLPDLLNSFIIFLQNNLLLVLLIGGQYFYDFFKHHIKEKEYLSLPYRFQYNEIWGRDIFIFYLAIFAPYMTYCILAGSESYEYSEDTDIFPLALLLSIIFFKTAGALIIKRIKDKLLKDNI